MGRREDREDLQSTWVVLETAEGPPRPFTSKDIEDAEALARADEAEVRRLRDRGHLVICTPRIPPDTKLIVSRRTYLPALARAAVEGADQVPMPK